MRITVLVENHKDPRRPDLRAAHGLALHVELGEHQLLFDVGPNSALAGNAAQLHIDLAEIDAVILSHHHRDHGGGLAAFLATNPLAPIYLRPPPGGELHFRALAGLIDRSIGLDPALFEAHAGRFHFIDKDTEVLPGVFAVPRIDTAWPTAAGNRYLFRKSGTAFLRDTFDHELLVTIVEDAHQTVLTGCAHHGVRNMVDAARRTFPEVPVKTVFGGFHLVGLPFLNTMAGTTADVEAIARTLLDLDVEQVYTGHCTGDRAFHVLQRVMGERIAPIVTGMSVEV